MNNIEESLTNAGLTKNESRVYLQLLKFGEQSANNIAKKTVMDRTLTYAVLNSLVEKGLVSHIIKESKKFFLAEDPSNLLNPLRERESIVKNLLVDLKSIQKEEDSHQEIKVFEGREALRTVFNLFKKYKYLDSFGATGRAYDYLYESPAIVKELEKAGLKGRIITSKERKGHPMTQIRSVKIRYLNIKSDATTTIFNDYVLIHIVKTKPLVILIKNKEIAESYRSHFEILWKVAKD